MGLLTDKNHSFHSNTLILCSDYTESSQGSFETPHKKSYIKRYDLHTLLKNQELSDLRGRQHFLNVPQMCFLLRLGSSSPFIQPMANLWVWSFFSITGLSQSNLVWVKLLAMSAWELKLPAVTCVIRNKTLRLAPPPWRYDAMTMTSGTQNHEFPKCHKRIKTTRTGNKISISGTHFQREHADI